MNEQTAETNQVKVSDQARDCWFDYILCMVVLCRRCRRLSNALKSILADDLP